MANTYTLISSNVLTGSAASVTFSSIPSTYTDLVLKYSARSSAGFFNQFAVQFDSTSAVYSDTILYGNGSSAASYANSSSTYLPDFIQMRGNAGAANEFASGEIYIPNYAGSAAKPVSSFSASESNSTSSYIGAAAGLYNLTSAISSIKLYDPVNGYSFVSGSSFYLYGIKNS